ncbi:MAG: calcium-binding protein [Kordiimonas sp.]
MADINGTGAADTLPTPGVDASGDDVFNPGAGNDTVDAGAGNDTINYTSGVDSITGGAGTDTVVVDADIVTTSEFTAYNIAGQSDLDLAGGGADLQLNGVEKIQFKNGTLDLNAGVIQYFGAELGLTTAAGTVTTGAGGADAITVGVVDVNTGEAAAADVIDPNVAFVSITKINGKDVSFGTAVTLSGGTVTATDAATDT